jgi:hypothetical protein
MEPKVCTYCGAEITDQGIEFRRQLFCSDECCETWEDEFLDKGVPDLVDLEGDDLEDDEFLDDVDLDDDDLDDDLLADEDDEDY